MSSAGRKSRTIRCIPAPTLFDLLAVADVAYSSPPPPHLLLLLPLLSSELLSQLSLVLILSELFSRWRPRLLLLVLVPLAALDNNTKMAASSRRKVVVVVVDFAPG